MIGMVGSDEDTVRRLVSLNWTCGGRFDATGLMFHNKRAGHRPGRKVVCMKIERSASPNYIAQRNSLPWSVYKYHRYLRQRAFMPTCRTSGLTKHSKSCGPGRTQSMTTESFG